MENPEPSAELGGQIPVTPDTKSSVGGRTSQGFEQAYVVQGRNAAR